MRKRGKVRQSERDGKKEPKKSYTMMDERGRKNTTERRKGRKKR